MAYVGFERVASSGAVKTVSDLTVPANATGAELQADTQAIRYTMDGTAPASGSGMLLLTTEGPKYFNIDEIRALKFIQGAGGAGGLNIHYHSGRDV